MQCNRKLFLVMSYYESFAGIRVPLCTTGDQRLTGVHVLREERSFLRNAYKSRLFWRLFLPILANRKLDSYVFSALPVNIYCESVYISC